MAEYRISGVWLDINTGEVTHYAFHEVMERTICVAVKKSKAEAIAILQSKDNTATTWIWDYSKATWAIGEEVEIAGGLFTNKYLRSDRNNKRTDHLAHLINFDWIAL